MNESDYEALTAAIEAMAENLNRLYDKLDGPARAAALELAHQLAAIKRLTRPKP